MIRVEKDCDLEKMFLAVSPVDEELVKSIKDVYKETGDDSDRQFSPSTNAERIHKIMPYFFPKILDGESPPHEMNTGGYIWIAERVGCKKYELSRSKNKMVAIIRHKYKS
jgi:hypothetical protein